MYYTEPVVTVLARPSFTEPGHLPVNWMGESSDGERLAEFAGRLCYMSQRNPASRTTRDYLEAPLDILGVPVSRPVVPETTALGAAYAAGLSVGYWSDTDELRLVVAGQHEELRVLGGRREAGGDSR